MKFGKRQDKTSALKSEGAYSLNTGWPESLWDYFQKVALSDQKVALNISWIKYRVFEIFGTSIYVDIWPNLHKCFQAFEGQSYLVIKFS